MNRCIVYLFEDHKLDIVLVRLLLFCTYLLSAITMVYTILLATLCTAKL